MTSQNAIYSLQEALKQERFKNAVYKKQVAQYQRDLRHRDSIIENLRSALAKHRKKSGNSSNIIASQELISNPSQTQADRDDCPPPSSQTTIDIQHSMHDEYEEAAELQDEVATAEEYLLNSSLSDTAVYTEPSSKMVTPRRQHSPSDYTVDSLHRPRANGDAANVLSCYVEHPSPSLRALNRKRNLDENDDADLQELQPIAPSANLERMNSFEQIFRRAQQPTPKENMGNYHRLDQHLENSQVDIISSQDEPLQMIDATTRKKPDIPGQNQAAASPVITDADSIASPGYRSSVDRRQQRSLSSPDFAYVDVVRNKYDRSKLHGRTCPCCSDFYRAVGTLPDIENTGRLQNAAERINRNSRHREVYKRPRTPPGFWNVEFPSSQELKQYKEAKIEAKIQASLSSFDES